MTHGGAMGSMALGEEICKREGADARIWVGASSLTRQRGVHDHC